MSTPMQILVARLYKISELHVNDLPEEREYKAGLRTAAVMAEGMLEKEKDVIENAYWDGGQQVPTVVSRCEDYYNETFNTTDQ
jgi:hypothetical protein